MRRRPDANQGDDLSGMQIRRQEPSASGSDSTIGSDVDGAETNVLTLRMVTTSSRAVVAAAYRALVEAHLSSRDRVEVASDRSLRFIPSSAAVVVAA